MYILDIETKPHPKLIDVFKENIKIPKNVKDPFKIEAAKQAKLSELHKLMSVDPDLCEIRMIGVKLIDGGSFVFTLEEYAQWLKEPRKNVDERRWKDLADSSTNAAMKMITFNGREFDLPAIIKAGLREKVDLPYKTLIMATDKYKGTNHLDLKEKVSMVWGRSKSLDEYLQIYLGVAKTPIDFETCTDEELKAHCLEDLENTEKLYKMFEPLFV